MKLSQLQIILFRLRVLIFVLLYLVGFWAPLGRGTLWLAASGLLARTGLAGLETATLVVTIAALACLTLGAVLRVWGTAYLGSAVMSGQTMQGQALIAAGPYRYVRNPLYLGSWFLALGVSVLMRPGGAAIFLVGFSAFVWLLVAGEERFLTERQGDLYRAYVRSVPRFFPRLRSAMAKPPAQPRWVSACLAETYGIAITLCFAVLAWRYNAYLLLKCVLVSYGLSLVVRALIRPVSLRAEG